MKRYEAYKKTKYDWLPQVPEHWATKTMRSLTTVSSERLGENTAELLSVYREYGVVIKSSRDDNRNVESEDLSNYKVVQKGDLVMNKMKMWQGSLGVSEFDGIVSPAYIVCHINGDDINRRYMHTLLRSACFKTYYNQYSYGVRVGQWDMHYEDFKGLEVSLPPRAEQDQIVRYLDWQVSKINRLIAAKRRQIQLLENATNFKLEQVLQNGLHGEILVETGNPWMSVAPKSWRKVRHKNVLTEKKTLVGENHSQHTLLSLTTKGVIIRDISSGKGKFPSDFSTYQVVEPSDMVFCLFDVDETPRTVGLSDNTGMITGAYTVFQPHDALPEYLLLYFTVIDNKKGFKPIYSGLRKVIGKDTFARQTMFLPSIEEQKEIVESIASLRNKNVKAVELFEKEIETLVELRTRLISDVVTGQIDVRGIEVPDFEFTPDVDSAEADAEDETEPEDEEV